MVSKNLSGFEIKQLFDHHFPNSNLIFFTITHGESKFGADMNRKLEARKDIQKRSLLESINSMRTRNCKNVYFLEH